MSTLANYLVIAASAATITTCGFLIYMVKATQRMIATELDAAKTKAQQKKDELTAVAEAIGVLVK